MKSILGRCDRYTSEEEKLRPPGLDDASIVAIREWLQLHIDHIARFYSEQVCGLYRAYSTENLKDPAKTLQDAWRDANFRHQDIPLSYSAWCAQHKINEQMATNSPESVSYFEKYLQQPTGITHIPFINFITNYFNQGGIYALETFIKSWGVPVEIMSTFSPAGTTFFKQTQLVDGTPVLQIKRDIHIIPNYMSHLTSGKLANDEEMGYPGPFCFVLTLNCEITQAISFANGEFNLQIIENPTYPIDDPQNRMMPDHIVTLIGYAIDYANDIAAKAAQPLEHVQLAAAAATAAPANPHHRKHWTRSSVMTKKFSAFKHKILGAVALARTPYLRIKLIFFSLSINYYYVCQIVEPCLKLQLASIRGIYYQTNEFNAAIISISLKEVENLAPELDSLTCLMSPSAIGKSTLHYPILTRSRIKSEDDFKSLVLMRDGHEKKLADLANVAQCSRQVLQVEVLAHCSIDEVIALLNKLNSKLAGQNIHVKLKFNHPSPSPSVRSAIVTHASQPLSPSYSPTRQTAPAAPMQSPTFTYQHAVALQQIMREILADTLFCNNINWFHKTVTQTETVRHFETQIANTQTLTALKILLEETCHFVKRDGFPQEGILAASADMARASIRADFRTRLLPEIETYMRKIICVLRESEA